MGGGGDSEQQVIYEGGGVALQHASPCYKQMSSDVYLLLEVASIEMDEEEGLMWQVTLCCAVRHSHVCLVFRKCVEG